MTYAADVQAYDEVCARNIQDIPWFLPSLQLWLNRSKRVLDIGCGCGHFVYHWRAIGAEAEGITYLPQEAEIAKQQLGIDLTVGDMHKLPYDDASFDAILMWDSLEHSISPYTALCEARRVTKKQGRGLIFVPGDSWQTMPYHVLQPTPAQMAQLLWLTGWTLYRMLDVSHSSKDSIENNAAIYCVINEDHARDCNLHHLRNISGPTAERIRRAAELPLP